MIRFVHNNNNIVSGAFTCRILYIHCTREGKTAVKEFHAPLIVVLDCPPPLMYMYINVAS